MTIKIHLPNSLSVMAKGKLQYEVEANSVGGCVDKLLRLVPGLRSALFYETGGLLPNVRVLVGSENGSTDRDDLKKKVKDGDEVFIKTNFR